MKKIQITLIIVSLGMILLPVLCMNTKEDQVSVIDNRKLTEFPEFDLSEELQGQFEQVEKYVEDRIGFRNEMVKGYTIANDVLFHKMIHPSYTYGKDGYIFKQIGFEKLDESYLDIYSDFVKKMQDDCEKQGILFEYWSNPDKTSVYPEYLPEGVTLRDKDIEYLLAKMDELGVEYFYSKELLTNAKSSLQVYNKKYDAGHWNDNGAFVTIQALQKLLKERGADIEPLDRDDFSIHTVEFDTLPVSYFPIQDSTDEYVLKNQQAIRTEEYDSMIQLDERFPEFSHYVNEGKEDAPKVLLFRGSYMEEREKFFIEQFSESTFIHSYYNIQNYQEYIDTFQPDIVIFECADYVINDEYFPRDDLMAE